MNYQLQYFDDALTDIQDAKVWYKEQREGLEVEFSIIIKQTIERILRMSIVYAVRYKSIGIAHSKRFPYNIHFYIEKSHSTVVITAIVHNHGNPIIARNRIDK